MAPQREESGDMVDAFDTSIKSESHDDPKLVSRQSIRRPKEPERLSPRSPRSPSKRGTDGFIAPSKRDKQLIRQVSALGFDDNEGVEEAKIIAPTRRERKLMRQVSGLGLEDPVFGKSLDLDDSIKKDHASFIFDDMDINDIPEDMRDMISLASDHTDIVDTDCEKSYASKSFTSMPPLGLDPESAAASSVSPYTRKKKLRKGKKPRIVSRNNSGDHSTAPSIVSEPVYVPPTGVFEPKIKRTTSKRRGSSGSASSIVMADKALAAQVDAMLSMNESNATNGFSTHSRTCGSSHRRGTRPKPRRQDSRFSVSSSTYVPPTLPVPAGKSSQHERHLPESMDEIFSSKKSSKKSKKKSIDGKKKKSKGKPLKSKDKT